jgi:hypothetical protein
MSFWTIMNGVAWAVSAFLVLLMLWDFVKVERTRRLEKRGPIAKAAEEDR